MTADSSSPGESQPRNHGYNTPPSKHRAGACARCPRVLWCKDFEPGQLATVRPESESNCAAQRSHSAARCASVPTQLMRLGQGICISHTDLTHQPSRLVSPFLQLLYRPEYPNPRTFPKCASTGLMGMSSKWIYGTSASSSDPVNIEHTHLSHLPRCAEPVIHTVAKLYNEP